MTSLLRVHDFKWPPISRPDSCWCFPITPSNHLRATQTQSLLTQTWGKLRNWEEIDFRIKRVEYARKKKKIQLIYCQLHLHSNDNEWISWIKARKSLIDTIDDNINDWCDGNFEFLIGFHDRLITGVGWWSNWKSKMKFLLWFIFLKCVEIMLC